MEGRRERIVRPRIIPLRSPRLPVRWDLVLLALLALATGLAHEPSRMVP